MHEIYSLDITSGDSVVNSGITMHEIYSLDITSGDSVVSSGITFGEITYSPAWAKKSSILRLLEHNSRPIRSAAAWSSRTISFEFHATFSQDISKLICLSHLHPIQSC